MKKLALALVAVLALSAVAFADDAANTAAPTANTAAPAANTAAPAAEAPKTDKMETAHKGKKSHKHAGKTKKSEKPAADAASTPAAQ